MEQAVKRAQTRDELIESHMPMAERVAKAALKGNSRVEVIRDDLIQAAYLGLVEAAETFDPSRGATFATYAFLRIRSYVLNELSVDQGVSNHLYHQVTEALDNYASRNPWGELPREYNHSLRDKLLYLTHGPIQAPEQQSPEDIASERQTLARFKKHFNKLSEKDQKYVKLIALEERSLAEAAKQLNVSRCHVSRRCNQIIRKLAKQLEREMPLAA